MRFSAPWTTRGSQHSNDMAAPEAQEIKRGTPYDVQEMSLMNKLQQFSVCSPASSHGLEGTRLTESSANLEHSHCCVLD